MKVTLNWLKQYVDFDWSPEELTERLTMLGLEVEGVQKLGGEFEGVVPVKVMYLAQGLSGGSMLNPNTSDDGLTLYEDWSGLTSPTRDDIWG